MRSPRITSLLIAVCCVVGLSTTAVGSDLGCTIDSDATFVEELSFTIPLGALGSAFGAVLGAIGAIPTAGASVVVGAIAGFLLIPDIQVTYGLDFSGTVDVGPCPSNVCGEGQLRLSATLWIESKEGFEAATIPPSTVLLKENYSILDNVTDCVDSCSSADSVDRNAADGYMLVGWEKSISTISMSLSFPITAGRAELPILQTGISAKGTIVGYVTANLGCSHADHPISLVGCPLDAVIPIDGFAQFTVHAEDPDYDHLDKWPATVPLLFEVTGFSDPRIRGEAFPGKTRNSAIIRIGTQSSVIDLIGRENIYCHVSVKDSRGSSDGETIKLHFVENHAPIAKRIVSAPITTEEFWDIGCKVAMEMAASDPDSPDNFGYDIWFSAAGTPLGNQWEAAKSTIYIPNPRDYGPINTPGGTTKEPSYTTSSQCNSSGTCSASATWWKAVDCPIPPGKYSFPYIAYEYSAESGYGLASSEIYTLHIVNTPPLAYDKTFSNVQGPTYLSVIEGNALRNGSVVDFDFDGTDLTAKLVPGSGPPVGTLDFHTDGSFVYYIDSRQPETTSFQYTVYDGKGGTDTATVTLEVYTPSDSPPSLSVSSLPNVPCAAAEGGTGECQNFEISITDPDFGSFWSGESLTLTVSIAGGGDTFYTLLGFNNGGAITGLGQAVGTLQIRPDRSFSSVTVRVHVEDSAKFEDVAVIVVSSENKDPQFYHANRWTLFGSASFSSLVASSGPSMFAMDPAWYEAGCLQFRDLDGDALTFRMTQFPRLGTANLFPSGSGDNYIVTVMYEVDRDEMLECHRARRDLVDQLTVQATDPYGGVSTATMNITFEVVNTPPVCENDSAVTPSGVPVLIDVLANDSDPDEDTLTIIEVSVPAGGGASIVADQVQYTPDPGICGTDTFTYTVDDDYEGQTTAWISVDVLDNVDPVAVCQPTTLYLDANGEATLDPASLDGGSTDNCSIAGFDASQKNYDCGDLGDAPVQLTVFDSASNTDICWTTVTVVDAIDPVAVGQNLTVQLDATGSVTVLGTQLDNGSTDNCGIASYLIDGAASKTFTCAHRGINVVTFNVIDASGNDNSVNVSVTVEDVLPPTAVCQNITASLDANAQVTVAASAVDGGSTDNCGIASLVLDRSSFTEADIGDQSVTLTVTDTSGNSASCSAIITVQDDTPPLITCPTDVDEQADGGLCYATGVNLGTPTATDNTDVDWATLTNNAPAQFPVGTTNVTWSVDDIYGNSSTCTQRVRVTEPVDPTVSCPGDIQEYTHDESGAVVTFSATASDNCDPSPQVSCSPSSGSTFPVGDTLVTCTATDDSGNTDTCTFTVTVVFQNDPPAALDDSGTFPEGGGCITISVLANDSDPDMDELTVSSVGVPQCGTTAITNGGTTIRYCTEGCSNPPDEITFSYTITDGYNSFDSAMVTVDMPDGPIIFIEPPPPPEDE